MKIFRHYRDVSDAYKGAVVAVGNFDGVHRGHQALIAEARRMAEERGASLGVLAFEPHPQEFFRPSPESFRLTPFRAKARLIAELGADVMYALDFNAEMAAMSAQDFVTDVLVGALGIGAIVVGRDFQFGKGRAGNTAMLAYMGEEEGFGVTLFDPVIAHGDDKISSTEIRDALKAGKPDVAARLLGHYWSVEARVEHGDKRGRTIGYPTANMKLTDVLKPAFGVYAVRAHIFEEDVVAATYGGVANFGIRPMFETPVPLLETFLFDFAGDLYNKHMQVELIAYLRPEAKFDSMDALIAQMNGDSEQARTILRQL
ncbi:MAG: bifunctional riboflavin kinase/FAD synthetase [Alphaproteobacteria bacterium]|nr:bifunctional riboflavin kinase/FAD synthetase [Alphaproteobacteria bacterium]MBL6938013.1 bifunctional riboflavin kinase/FAD synthetase [Alphaproteobacteria bacterium]MBL7099162.1 bifunctional riboflavin kinase/FAD synthetase [Alphaproteobacteria bacterium]